MTYFEELASLPNYPSTGPDFKFSYNPNSGGGQAFLAGRPIDGNKHAFAPSVLSGKKALLKFQLDGSSAVVPSQQVEYQFKPRSAGSTQMKLAVPSGKNPSRIVIAFLMLPDGCGARKSADLSRSVLSKNNYWLQQMRLDYEEIQSDPSTAYLVPSDFVFGAGVEDGGNASNERYFRLDAQQRVKDIIALSQNVDLPKPISEALQVPARVFLGHDNFDLQEAQDAIEALMLETARVFPTKYSGVDDPLPVLVDQYGSNTSDAPRYRTDLGALEKRNLIVFGAPGTGKSFNLEQRKDLLLADGGEFERVTFHPDYTYAHFVGTYKPVPITDSVGRESITYTYIPGPFMRLLAKALRNGQTDDVKPHLLVIEEINRASATAVFGEVFQLLDRGRDNVSQYPIHASEDIKQYLADAVGGSVSKYDELRLPDNLFIWCSMNSADQGVFPMDTAFKRRWDFIYTGIDENDGDIAGNKVTLGRGTNEHTVEWNQLRKAINDYLASKGVNEDKQIGPYFLSREISVPATGSTIDESAFIPAFQQKVLMYLFEDAARQHRASLFDGCEFGSARYSEICRDFQERGVGIFNSQIVTHVTQSSNTRDSGYGTLDVTEE